MSAYLHDDTGFYKDGKLIFSNEELEDTENPEQYINHFMKADSFREILKSQKKTWRTLWL